MMDIAYELGMLAGYASEMAVLVAGEAEAFNTASENYWSKRKEIIREVQRLQKIAQQVVDERHEGNLW